MTPIKNKLSFGLVFASLLSGSLGSCFSKSPEGLAPSQPAETTVKFDFFHRPLPDIPMPNDLATRVDKTSATGLRINASKVASSEWERSTREHIDQVDGWGTMQSINIPFTGRLDIDSIVAGHRDTDYDFSNDVVYLVNVDPDSEEYGKVHHIDMGEGNFPVSVEEKDAYWKNDPRVETTTLLFEEYDEDLNGNGALDPGEDTDSDGILDKPNYYPGMTPDWDDLAARSDAHMTFYELQTDTLIVRPILPLRERTTYAVIVTRRILDEAGNPVGSPFEFVNHTSQTKALKNLVPVMPEYFTMDDIAFAFTYTTQTVQSAMVAVRDGLYGHGVQAHIADTSTAVDLLLARSEDILPGLKRPYILRGEEWIDVIQLLGGELLGGNAESAFAASVLESLSYIDYMTTGSFQSPQLRERFAEDGSYIELNKQSWPEDIADVKADVTEETLYFTLVVPRKEVSARGEGKPAPLVVVTHGHTGNRASNLLTAGWFAQHGFATLAIDAPGHGLAASPGEAELFNAAFNTIGAQPFGEGLYKGRAIDLNGDGEVDSGTDFWTSFLFHTRDNLRQYALDVMQTVKVVNSFDGVLKWADVDGDGEADLAGDFDGDGVLDIGEAGEMYLFGGSMGGITAMLLAGIEPEFEAVAPLVGGAPVSDIGFRSDNNTVPGSFFLRGVMGPIWVGTLDEDGDMLIEHIVEELARDTELEVATAKGVEVGDLMVITNTKTDEVGCGLVLPNGEVRAGTEVSFYDPVTIAFYRDVMVVEGSHCEMDKVTEPVEVISEFGNDVSFHGLGYLEGEPLQSLGEGVGRLRGHPNLRRLRGLGQLVLDPGDPINFACHVQTEPMTHPGTGQTTGAHILSMSILGDMNVPTAAGIAWGRAAGIINFLDEDPRYGKSINQVLIDTHTVEGVNTQKRFVDEFGVGVHMDVEHFSKGMEDKWGASYPRLEAPLRIGFDEPDPLGGRSTVIFPLTKKQGEHGFSRPGDFRDDHIEACLVECEAAATECNCKAEDLETYDVGYWILNFLGTWLKSGGMELKADLCMARNDCPEFAPPPARRADADLL
ncbi:MAG: hypothetical protein GY811_23185 [Myxococcales bacterium]|nr:hypothetical protein [Myxococcales bacterium]